MSPLTALTKQDSQDTNDHSAKEAGKPDSMYEKNTDDSSGYFKLFLISSRVTHSTVTVQYRTVGQKSA